MTPNGRRIRLDLAYDGTDFAGWQHQPGRRTVQGVLEQALSELQGGERVVVRGAGRTDAGVHAAGQVADCELRTRLDDGRLEHALRGMLPADVRVRRARTVAPDFHARNDAISKTYRYRLDRSAHGDPFRARFALHYPHPLDLVELERALGQLPGKRDWSGFTAAGCTIGNRVREMTEASIDCPAPDEAVLTFTADGFLQHMVRNLVGTLLEIGSRRMPAGTIDRALASGDRTLAGPTAPARGLCLMEVRYPCRS